MKSEDDKKYADILQKLSGKRVRKYCQPEDITFPSGKIHLAMGEIVVLDDVEYVISRSGMSK